MMRVTKPKTFLYWILYVTIVLAVLLPTRVPVLRAAVDASAGSEYALESTGEPITLHLSSVDASRFPDIYVYGWVRDSYGKPIEGLTRDDFVLTEQSELEEHPVGQTLSVSTVEGTVDNVAIVLAIDRSTSMSSTPMANAKEAAKTLVDTLKAEDRCAVVSFGSTVALNHGFVGTDEAGKTSLKEAINKLSASGSTALYRAIYDSVAQVSGEVGVPAVVVLTDGKNNISPSQPDAAIALAQANGVPVYTIGLGSVNEAVLRRIADETGGSYYYTPKSEELMDIYLEIAAAIQGQYLLAYRTHNRDSDGTVRTIEVTVDYLGQIDSGTIAYKAAKPPQISLTTTTKGLIGAQQPGAVALSISAQITSGTGIATAKLFYRTSGIGEAYRELSMTDDGSTYSAVIPGDHVKEPGVEFYLTASDGVLNSSSPNTKPGEFPHQIAVHPNDKPIILHVPVQTASPWIDISIEAVVTDEAPYGPIDRVVLFYRPSNEVLFTRELMDHANGIYNATIPASSVTLAGVDYYILAVDIYGVKAYDGTADWPHHTATDEVPANHRPIAALASMSTPPKIMYPDEPYTVTVAYHDPDGMEDLKYCYLRLNHPTKPLTLMWNRATDEYWVWAGEEGANYATVSGHTVPMHDSGYDLNWQFTLKDSWPKVEDAIDFGVFAADNQGAVSGPDFEYRITGASFLYPPVSIAISPKEAEIKAGESQSYTVVTTDGHGTAFDVSAYARFAVSSGAGGTWVDNTYTPEAGGEWTVFANHAGLSDTARLTVYTHRIAYIPVEFPDKRASRQISQLKKRATAVEQYYNEQSYGKVVIKSDFVLEEHGGHILVDEDYGFFEKQAGDAGAPRVIAELLLEDEAEIAAFAKWLIGQDETFIRSLWITAETLLLESVDIHYSFDTQNWLTFEDYDTAVVIQPPELRSFAWYELAYTSEQSGLSTWAHELGHSVFDWQDYYRESGLSWKPFWLTWTDKPGGFVGPWCMMGHHGNANPAAVVMSFNKIDAGWLSRSPAAAKQEISLLHELNAGDSVYTYAPLVGDVDYFIFEGRHPKVERTVKDPVIDDLKQALKPDKGIMIYIVQGGKVYSLRPQVPRRVDPVDKVTLVPDGTYVYKDLPSEVKFTAVQEGSTLYVKIDPFVLPHSYYIRIDEASINYEVSASELAEPYTDTEWVFDVSLRVYTEDGRVVGPDYEASEYRMEIEGALTSGPTLGGGPEWIAVPSHEKVCFAIDPTPALRWAEELGISLPGIEAKVSARFYDGEGKRTEVDPVTVTVSLDKPTHGWIKDGAVKVRFDLTISSSPGGSVTVPGVGAFDYAWDDVVDLEAEAEEGYRFVNWTGDVDHIESVNSRSTTITMKGDYVITANFVATQSVVGTEYPLWAILLAGFVAGASLLLIRRSRARN